MAAAELAFAFWAPLGMWRVLQGRCVRWIAWDAPAPWLTPASAQETGSSAANPSACPEANIITA